MFRIWESERKKKTSLLKIIYVCICIYLFEWEREEKGRGGSHTCHLTSQTPAITRASLSESWELGPQPDCSMWLWGLQLLWRVTIASQSLHQQELESAARAGY